MDAFEWLKENYLPESEKHSWKSIETLNDPVPVMERYANYRTKELQALILEFRQRLSKVALSETVGATEAEYWLKMYDLHFNIQEVKSGK